MTFEVYLAGLLGKELERTQAIQIIADLNKRHKDSEGRVEVIVAPRIGTSDPDLLVNYHGIPIILELKGVYEQFRLRVSDPENPTSKVVWEDPNTFLLEEFAETFHPGEQAIRFRREFIAFLAASAPTNGGEAQGPPNIANPYSWIVVQPGNHATVAPTPADGFPWLDIVPIDVLDDRCAKADQSNALPGYVWNGIHRHLQTERAHVGGWPKKMDKKYRQLVTAIGGRFPAGDQVRPSEEIHKTISKISESEDKEYAAWLAKQSETKDPAVRNAALATLIRWQSELAGPALVRDLQNGDQGNQTRALDALSRIRCDAAIPVLRGMLRGEEHKLAAVLSALTCCAQWGAFEDVTGLLRGLVGSKTPLEDNRWGIVIRAMGRFGGEPPARELISAYHAIPTLPTKYPHSTPDSRREEIMWELGTNSHPLAGEFLALLLGGDRETSDSALRSLTRGPHPEAVRALRSFLFGGSSQHCEFAIHALSVARTEAARNLLLERLEQSLRTVPKADKDDIAWRIGREFSEWSQSGRQAVESRLCKWMDGGGQIDRERALMVLSQVLTNSSAETLWKLIPEPEASERASWMLERLGGAITRARATELLSRNSPMLVSAGVRILARVDDPAILARLKELETHESDVVRITVAEAYTIQNTPLARHRLLRLLKDSCAEVVTTATYAVRGDPRSHTQGCLLRTIGGEDIVGQLWVGDACVMILDRKQRGSLRTIPFDEVKSHALWKEEDCGRGIWLTVIAETGPQDVVLLPRNRAGSPWREEVEDQWYPPIALALPVSKTKCEGVTWERVRRLLPPDTQTVEDREEREGE